MAKKRRKNKEGAAAAPGKGKGSGPRQGAREVPSVPRGIPALVFVLATVVLFGEFIFSREMLYGGDTLSLGYMARAFFAERLA